MRPTLAALAALLIAPSASLYAQAELDVKQTEDAKFADFKFGGKLVTRYHFGPNVAKPYFWPMHTPAGVPVTRAWPMEKAAEGETTDHLHQKSAWFCHGDVIPEGLELKNKIKGVTGVDFWSETAGHGKIVCTKVGETRSDANGLTLVTSNEWRTADGIVILKEERNITLADLGSGYLVTLDIALTPTEYAITFGDTKEGSMGVRVNDKISVKPGGGNYANAEGKIGETEVWGRKSLWCDYFGKVDGKEAGIAVFDDPKNPHPATWHARGYGLMAANPFGRAKSGFPDQKGKDSLVKLAKGETLKLRYGILLHDGDTKAGKVAEAFTAFQK